MENKGSRKVAFVVHSVLHFLHELNIICTTNLTVTKNIGLS